MAQFLPTTKGKKRRKRNDTHGFTELKYILNKCNGQTLKKKTHTKLHDLNRLWINVGYLNSDGPLNIIKNYH